MKFFLYVIILFTHIIPISWAVNFEIKPSGEFKNFPLKLSVFDIPIYATTQVEKNKMVHAAHILAEYLDNDEDGKIDNPKILKAMHDNNTFLVIWKNEQDLDRFNMQNNAIGQDLGADEIQPEWHNSPQNTAFDASLEEVWHLISNAGYAIAYPDIFGTYTKTALSDAMDIARGGYFKFIPKTYPKEAWYSYNDKTCNYECMVSEYFYWALTSKLGAQSYRKSEINHEWKLYTPTALMQQDMKIYQLLDNPEYKLPQQLPDGKYTPIQ